MQHRLVVKVAEQRDAIADVPPQDRHLASRALAHQVPDREGMLHLVVRSTELAKNWNQNEERADVGLRR
jgi:hypothetical protein